MVFTPTMHSDKDMKTLLALVSDTDVVGIVTIWLELFKVIHCEHHLPKENLCATYQFIPLWLDCAQFQHHKKTLAVWRRIQHITPLLYEVYLPITESFVELEHYVSCANS